MPDERASVRRESGAIFQAALLAAGTFCWAVAILVVLLPGPGVAHVVGAGAGAWLLALRLGFRAHAATLRWKAARAVLVPVFGLVPGALAFAFSLNAFDEKEQQLVSLATVGILLVLVARWRLRRRPEAVSDASSATEPVSSTASAARAAGVTWPDQPAIRGRLARLAEPAGWLLLIGGTATILISGQLCVGTWLRQGVVIPVCPDGELRQTLAAEVTGLRRGGEGVVSVRAIAHYTVGVSDQHLQAPVRAIEVRLALVSDKGVETPLAPKTPWRVNTGYAAETRLVLDKELSDGEYRLRAHVTSRLGADSVDVPLPLFAPARVHVLTDRPLYEPGHKVQMRAVVLRGTDLAPLDGRPGKWIVTDPGGDVVLEEKAPAGAFGVVSGTFPLDRGAAAGTWKVRWSSGDAHDEATIAVRPFTLPRLRVEAAADRPFYGKGARPAVRGKVLYASGAPVRGAALALEWSASGAWPPPTAWLGGALPTTAKTDAAGAFELRLPAVPDDLRGQAILHARVRATDPAGDTVTGSATVLLAEDAIAVSALTELEGGLVQGFNNRLYLRATTAGGEVLGNTELVVRRAWDENDQGVVTTTDEDGVASLAIDPGPPINVVLPPMPVRPPPPEPPVVRSSMEDVLGDGEPSLADRLALDRLNQTLAPCGRFAAGEEVEATVALRVTAAGAVTAGSDGDQAARCVARVLDGKRLPAGRERLLVASYALRSPLPRVSVLFKAATSAPKGLETALQEAALDARACTSRTTASGALPRVLTWRARPAQRVLVLSFARDPNDRDPNDEDDKVPPVTAACIERRLLAVRWADLRAARTSGEAPDEDSEQAGDTAPGAILLGSARVTFEAAGVSAEQDAAETTKLGYELHVAARKDKRPVGTTRLVLEPGKVPPLRLRATPVLARPGSEVVVNLLRGPEFSGELPATLSLRHRHGSLEAKVDVKGAATFKLPADAKGWFEVEREGARALVFVRPEADLRVSLQTDAPRYAPGQTAAIAIQTSIEGAGRKTGQAAAVGLFGVDASLAQLAPLPGPDSLARLRPMPSMRAPAFGALEVSGLELGRIRGANAAAATVMQVTQLPPVEQEDVVLSASVAPAFEPLAALTDNFYRALAELHVRVRAWQASTPAGQMMTPAAMASLWDQALAACEARREPVTDAYGRRLRLHHLPDDLLSLADPHAVVTDGTRLPEDVEPWAAWVRKVTP